MHLTTSLLHWSDTHTGAGPDERDNLRALVAHVIATYSPATTTIAISGDLTDDGAAHQYSQLRAILRPLETRGYKILAVPGNHDCGPLGLDWDREARARFDLHVLRPLMHMQPAPWPLVASVGGWRAILLDTCEGNHDDLVPLARGELGRRQMARLEVALQDDDRPTLVLCHHHPLKADWLHALDEADELVAMLARRSNVKLVLFGHMHQRGVIVGTGAGQIPYAADAGKTTAPDAAGDLVYTLHRLGGDGSHVAKEVRVPLAR